MFLCKGFSGVLMEKLTLTDDEMLFYLRAFLVIHEEAL